MSKKSEKNVVEVENLNKVYDDGFQALTNVNLSIREGEIFALLGPNGAGKTTLISIICGLVNKSSGDVTAYGRDVVTDYRFTRSLISLVPQEIMLDPFLTVTQTLAYARGFYGEPRDDKLIEETLHALSLWDKKDNKVQELSGGMKRRVLIGKALMNEPKILFLDEPTAGVDVELRKGMWDLVWDLKARGVTTILTTHYIEEAQEMADRVGIINKGKIDVVEEKTTLMQRFGSKELVITLADTCPEQIDALAKHDNLTRSDDGTTLTYAFKSGEEKTGVTTVLNDLRDAGLTVTDIETRESSLEDIFVNLIHEGDHK